MSLLWRGRGEESGTGGKIGDALGRARRCDAQTEVREEGEMCSGTQGGVGEDFSKLDTICLFMTPDGRRVCVCVGGGPCLCCVT